MQKILALLSALADFTSRTVRVLPALGRATITGFRKAASDTGNLHRNSLTGLFRLFSRQRASAILPTFGKTTIVGLMALASRIESKKDKKETL